MEESESMHQILDANRDRRVTESDFENLAVRYLCGQSMSNRYETRTTTTVTVTRLAKVYSGRAIANWLGWRRRGWTWCEGYSKCSIEITQGTWQKKRYQRCWQKLIRKWGRWTTSPAKMTWRVTCGWLTKTRMEKYPLRNLKKSFYYPYKKLVLKFTSDLPNSNHYIAHVFRISIMAL